MTILEWVGRLFDAMFWADARVLKSLGRGNPAGRRYFDHLLAAERVWLMRLRGESSAGQAIWPELTEAEAERMVTENQEGYRDYLAGLSKDDLEKRVEYRNQTGLRFSTSVGDILLHVATHGAYHRGQVARDLREAGLTPVNTDFITYIREMDEAAGV